MRNSSFLFTAKPRWLSEGEARFGAAAGAHAFAKDFTVHSSAQLCRLECTMIESFQSAARFEALIFRPALRQSFQGSPRPLWFEGKKLASDPVPALRGTCSTEPHRAGLCTFEEWEQRATSIRATPA